MNKPLTDKEICYAAGFFDGEGCISVMKRVARRRYGVYFDYAMHVRIANTNFDVLEWLQIRFGGSIYDHTSKKNRGNRQQSWVLHLHSTKAKEFLLAIEPFVVVKRKQIAIAYKFLALRGTTAPRVRAEIYEQMKELNLRGIKQQNGTGPASVTTNLMSMEDRTMLFQRV